MMAGVKAATLDKEVEAHVDSDRAEGLGFLTVASVAIPLLDSYFQTLFI